MKKRMKSCLIWFLCFSLLLPGTQSFAYADVVSEETQENMETSAQIDENSDAAFSIDLSEYIVKEGGFLTPSKEAELGEVEDVKQSAFNGAKEKLSEAIYNVDAVCDLSEYDLSVDTLTNLLVKVANENPRYFYVDYSNVSYTTEDDHVKMVEFAYEDSEEDVKIAISEYDKAINEILSGVSPKWSELEKALYINDYLTAYCEYDLTYSKYTAYDIIVNKTGVCQAYAEAFLELMTRLGITCDLVTSWELNHAWNMVVINDKYYNVDVTWNDPVTDRMGYAKHNNFMKSTAFFKSEYNGHNSTDWYTYNSWDINLANDKTYDNYFWDDIRLPFQYAEGKWYTISASRPYIVSYTCDGKNFKKDANVLALEEFWNGEYGYFGGFSKYGSYIYYNSANNIYAFKPSTGKSTVLYTLTASEKKKGGINGLRATHDGKIEYALAPYANERTKDFYKVNAKKESATDKATYTVKYYGNGSDAGKMSSQVLEQDTYESLYENTFTKKHYEFDSWNTKADGSGKRYKDKAAVVNLSKKDGATVKLYAQWKPIYYSIMYGLPEDGSNHPKNPYRYTIEDEVKLYEPTSPGEVFVEWIMYTDEEKAVTKIPKGTTGDIYLLSVWRNCKYNIVLDGNGSTSGSKKQLKECLYSVEYKLPKCPFTKKGYTFKGWNREADGSSKAYADKATVKNLTKVDGKTVTLYAQWERTKYKVTYELNGGKNHSDNPTAYYITSAAKTLKKPTKEGYTFKGWYSDSKLTKKVTEIPKGSTGNKKFYAKWSVNKYKIAFDGNGATSGKMDVLTSRQYAKTYTLTANKFKRTGYTFKGWNRAADGSSKAYADKSKVKNLTKVNGKVVTLYAQWTPNKYKIVFDGNGATSGKMNALSSRTYGKTYALTENAFKKKGYRFVGWNTSPDGSKKSYKNKEKVKNLSSKDGGVITLYAQWEKMK